MKPPPFAYARPASVEEAAGLLGADDGATLLAGGQSLVPMLNLRMTRPTTLIDISSLPDLAGIDVGSDTITVGAMTTHAKMERHPWPDSLTALARGVSHIGYPAIRHRGTVGGSLAHADPAAELPSLMVSLDASIQLRSANGSRTVPAEDFFVGYYSTARSHTEIVTSVSLPLHSDLRSGFSEFSRRVGDFAIALAAVARWNQGGESKARVVVGGLDSRPRRIDTIEAALIEGKDWRDVCTPEVVSSFAEPTSDIHGSADYRLHLGAEMVRRAIREMEGTA